VVIGLRPRSPDSRIETAGPSGRQQHPAPAEFDAAEAVWVRAIEAGRPLTRWRKVVPPADITLMPTDLVPVVPAVEPPLDCMQFEITKADAPEHLLLPEADGSLLVERGTWQLTVQGLNRERVGFTGTRTVTIERPETIRLVAWQLLNARLRVVDAADAGIAGVEVFGYADDQRPAADRRRLLGVTKVDGVVLAVPTDCALQPAWVAEAPSVKAAPVRFRWGDRDVLLQQQP
jgi:hypothetical protein